MTKPKIITVTDKTSIMLTVPGKVGRTCVYITLENGKLVFTGGSSIIERIEGEKINEKVKK